ncbi:deoxynucleotide monophosphate kinase family protein [Chelatococcus asaccharovorans]|uniref:deoxynucleotide monophosphate kinase family protein n=1 Tax=Chelatococcus asaccharovorans TaxID=28210 RepID=UPI00224C6E7E|nr:hypothetical protein [Chelatococcus asaccharovorans]CAH1672363.1 hypothetical protein CHELA17_61370 [Chelatococcus asaccharovorans]CAH1676211.1 hypothetical protein CHELA40_14249 [Chelatococcus asaccharovorans]
MSNPNIGRHLSAEQKAALSERFAVGAPARAPRADARHGEGRGMIIGLMGYAGAGKSEVARHLRERHGFETPHIGRPLKRMLAELLRDIGYDEATIIRFVDGDLKRSLIPELGITSTEAQQTLGTEWGRNCVGADFWLSLWLGKVDRVIQSGGRVVQESVRFANEVDSLRQRGALLVEVQRPGVGPISGHPSEVLPARADLVLQNGGTIADLRSAVDAVLSSKSLCETPVTH